MHKAYVASPHRFLAFAFRRVTYHGRDLRRSGLQESMIVASYDPPGTTLAIQLTIGGQSFE
jgi:hypothetical protein